MRKFTADKVDPVSLDFSVWDYSIPEIYGIIVGMFVKLDLVECLNISESELLDFVIDVDRGYLQVFYHSFHHAADVTSVLYHMLLHMNASQYLSKPDMAALLLAGLCHDIGHPGLNNLYQVNAKSELAQQFGDASVLEKYSCSMAMDLVTKHRLFRNIAESSAATLPEGNRPTEESMRESMIKAIMATDMSFHYDMLNNLNALIEFTSMPLPSPLHSGHGCCSHGSSGHGSESESETDLDSMPPSPTTEASCQRRFECPVARHTHRRQSSASSISSMCSEGSSPVSYGRPTVRSPSDLTPELRQSLSNCLLHAADISNPVKPWGLCKRWSDLVVQEFFLQGDIEKSQSLPVSPNMDRDQHNQPQISLGFSDYVVQPYFECVAEFLPEAAPFLVTLASNREQWALLKEVMLAEKKAIAAAQASITITVAETAVAEEISDNGDVSTTVASTVATEEDVVVKPLTGDDNKLKPRVDTRPLHLSPSEKVRDMASPSTPVFLIPDTRVSVAPGVVDLHDMRSQRQGHRRSRHTNNPDTVHHGGHHAIRRIKRSFSGKTLSTSVRDSDVAQAQPPPHSHTGTIPTLNQEMVSQKKHEPAIVDGKDPLTNVTEDHQHDQPPDGPKVDEASSEDERILPPPIPVRVLTRASFFHNKFVGLPTPDASPRTELSPFIMETDPPNGPSGQGRMMARPRHGSLQLESNHPSIRQEYGDGYVLLMDPPDGMDDHSVDNAKIPMDPLALPGVMNGSAEAALLSSIFPTGCKPPDDDDDDDDDEDDGSLDFKTITPSPSMSVSTALTMLFTKNGGPPAPILDVLEDEVVDPKVRPIPPSSLLASEDEGGPGIGCIVGTTATLQCDEDHHLDTDKTRAMLASALLMDGAISIATASAGGATT
jgi:hypothetical protein